MANSAISRLTRPDRQSLASWLTSICLIAGVVLLGCAPVLSGKAVPLWDAGDYFGPMFSLIADHLRCGRLMLWDPWINGGSPDFAEPQLGSASPVVLAFALLPPDPFHGFIAYWLSLWIFGGIGMLLLCQHLGAPVWGSRVIALGFIACGIYTANAEHTSWICSFSFLPWVLWRFDVGLIDRRLWCIVQTAVLWGVSAQGGYPGVAITTPIFLTLWGAGRLWTSRSGMEDQPSLRQHVLLLLVAAVMLGLIGSAVMSATYVSFLRETRGYSLRANDLDRQFSVSSGVLPPAAYATLISPYLYQLQSPDHRTLWRETDISMVNVYMGVLTLVLALAALSRPSRWRFWLFLVAVFFGCCAVGNRLPVRGWLYDWVPPTRYFRMPSLFRMYVILVAGALAAYATRDLEVEWQGSGSRARITLLAISAIEGLAALLTYTALLRSVKQDATSAHYPLFHLLVSWAGITVISLGGVCGWLSRRTWVNSLIVLAVVDAALALYISSPTMFSFSAVSEWKAMDVRHVTNLDLLPNGWERTLLPTPDVGMSPNNRNVAWKIAGLNNRTPLKNAYFQKYVEVPELSSIAVGSQRVWFSDQPVWLSPSDRNLAEFVKVSRAIGSVPMTLQTPSEMTDANTLSSQTDPGWTQKVRAMIPAKTILIAYTPNDLTFRYYAERDGWLLLTDRWANAWSARVNGRAQPIMGGNFIFRAIPVVRGDNLVEFHYRPRTYYFALLTLSWLVMFAVLVVQPSIWRIWRRRQVRIRVATALPGKQQESARCRSPWERWQNT
ncbi:MAG TPA: hypothetical protein VMT53_08100 [Terriglobales bacterium]|nr:hypothetical protein [Terriglobales bacterium]